MATFAANLPNFQRVNKSALFFAFHLHLFGALVVLQNVSDALFFSTIGVQSLPMVRFILAGVMLPLTLVYERISARDEKSRAFSPMLLLSGLLVLVLTVVRSFHEAGSVYALMVASPVLQAFLLAEFWTFASRYFTLGESKRAFPLLFAAASLGGIIAGLVTSTLASSLGSQGLLLLWLLLHWACLGYVFLVRRHLRELPDPRRESAPVQRLASRRSLWRRLWDALSAQPLATGIIALSFLGAVALFLAEYAYYDIFVRAYPDTNELTEFIGFWSAISSALNFALAFFLLPRITAQLGVRNVTLIQPLLAIVVFVAALSMPVLLVGVFSYLAIQSRNAIEESNEKLLYKGLSNELGQLVRARSEGAGKPLAAALAASLLYVFGDPESVLLGLFGLLGSVEFVSAAGIVVGLAYFGVAFYTRVAYPKAIVERIRTRSFDVSADEQSPGLESDESRNLLEQQIESEDTELVRFAADYLHGLDAKRAVELLAHRLRRADSELAAELLELLSHWGCGDYPEMDALLEEHLHHEQARVRAAAIALAASLDDPPIAAVLSGLEDPSADVRREAIAALCTHWDLMLVARGAEALGALLESEASSERIAGGAILARLNDRRHLRMLTPLLLDPDIAVQQAAAQHLSARVDESCGFLLDELLAALPQAHSRAQQPLVEALLAIGDSRVSEAILAHADALPLGLLQRCAIFLASQGEPTVDLLRSIAQDAGRSHPERILSVQSLALGGKQRRDFLSELARCELTEAYSTLRDGHQCLQLFVPQLPHALSPSEPEGDEQPPESAPPSILMRLDDASEILQLALADRRREALELVVEIVGFASRHPDFDTIRSYCFSPDPVARSYAIEALENVADRPVFELLLPFLTLDPKDELRMALGELGERLGLARKEDDVLARRLEDPHPWLRACALFAATKSVHSGAGAAALRCQQEADPILKETGAWAEQWLAARAAAGRR